MKKTFLTACAAIVSATCVLARPEPAAFEFSGFRLGMTKKELGAMSPAMRPWKPVGLMDARKDEWDLTPAKLSAPPPPFPKLSGIYNDKPLVHGVKLAWTNGMICKITVEGPMTASHAKARDWAAAAQEVLTTSLGRPAMECEALTDQTGEALLESLRKGGVVGAFWPNASVSVFRWSDSADAAGLAGRIIPSFEVSTQKLNDVTAP